MKMVRRIEEMKVAKIESRDGEILLMSEMLTLV